MTKLGWKVWKKSLQSLRAELQSLRAELQSLRAELQSLRAESIAVCMQRWSFRRRSVLGNLLWLVRNESSCSPWSFSAPSSEDLAWTSNQVDPTRFFMIFHADHTCSWESRWLAHSADLRSRLRHVSSAPSVAYSTGCSRVVTHPGTNPARRCW